MKKYKDLKREFFKDQEVKKAYQGFDSYFELVRIVIEKRLKKSFTQKELALRIGTKQSAISRFEFGKYNPTLLFLNKLADALGAKIKISVS